LALAFAASGNISCPTIAGSFFSNNAIPSSYKMIFG